MKASTVLEDDMRLVPHRVDRWALMALIVVALLVPPFLSEYWLKGILIPTLILSIQGTR